MSSADSDSVEPNAPAASPVRVGTALVAVGTAWIGLSVGLRASPVDPSRLFARSSVLGLYPGSAARLLDADVVGVVTVAVGLCVIGLATLGRLGDGSSTTGAPLRFRTAVGVSAVGFAAAVATLPFGPPPGGPVAGPPVTEWLVEVRLPLANDSQWLYPHGTASGRRRRATAGAGIVVVPVAGIAFTLALLGSQAGLAVLVGFFVVGVSIALIAVTAAYAFPLYLAGRLLGGRGAPEWLPTAWYRSA